MHDVVVLIDRKQGGYDLRSAFTIRQMLDFYLRAGRLTPETYQDTQQRLQALNQFLGR